MSNFWIDFFLVPDKNICNLRPDSGMCLAYFERYYFEKTSGECKIFVFGGCGGNMNNFETFEECAKSCGATGSKNEAEIETEEEKECNGQSDEENETEDKNLALSKHKTRWIPLIN